MTLVWLALDGVGHPGDAPPDSVWDTDLPTLRPLVDAGRTLDARLGVPGLPQSATGQTAWLTGVNAARHMGRHYGPQPGPTLRALLDVHALLPRLTRAGGRAALANRYVPAYLAAQERRPRWGCFAHAALAAGLPLNPPLPLVSPTLGLRHAHPWEAARSEGDIAREGEALALAAAGFDLVVCDLWLSDLLGHRGGGPQAGAALRAGRAYLGRVDALLAGLLAGGAAVLVTSDHGNLEDLGTKTHTLARVPLAGTVPLPPGDDIAAVGAGLPGLLGL